MTRPKMNTNIIGCKNVCSSNGIRFRRATWPSRASRAKKVFQFIRASSGPYDAKTNSPDWVLKCAHRTVPPMRLMQDSRSQKPTSRHGLHRYLPHAHHPAHPWCEPLSRLLMSPNAATTHVSASQSAAATRIHQELSY